MFILNIIGVSCFILVKGNVIPLEFEEDSIRSLESAQNENDNLQYDCSSLQMTVKGFNIRMSDVIKHECWSTASDIKIFALHKISIDCDVIKNSAQLSIYAPTWESIGNQEIILSGENGESHKIQLVAGKNGEPGLPGGAGGLFIGVGQNFINADELIIKANGGDGGPGQNGAKGINAIDGDEFKEEFINSGRMLNNFETFLNELKLEFTKTKRFSCTTDYNCRQIWMFEIEGGKANASGNGGNGGAGGLGGPVGLIHLEGFDNMPNNELDKGENGMGGLGGSPGNFAHNGRNVECVFSLYMDSFIGCKWGKSIMGPNGKTGKYAENWVNRKQPPIAINTNYGDILKTFKEFVRMNLVKSGERSDPTGFITLPKNTTEYIPI